MNCPMCDATIRVYERHTDGALVIARHGSIQDGECPASGQSVTRRSVCEGDAYGDGYPGTRYFHKSPGCPGHD